MQRALSAFAANPRCGALWTRQEASQPTWQLTQRPRPRLARHRLNNASSIMDDEAFIVVQGQIFIQMPGAAELACVAASVVVEVP